MSEYNKNTLSKKAKPLKKYWTASFAVLGFLVLTPVLLPDTWDIIEKVIKGKWSSVDFYQLGLYLVTFYLIGAWLWSTWYELDILCQWLTDGYVPPTNFLEAIICIGLALFGWLLILLVKSLPWYIGVFTTYSFFNIFIGGIHTLSEVGGAVNSSLKSLNTSIITKGEKQNYEIEAYEKALKAIRLHWVKNLEGLQRYDGYLRHYVLPKWYMWLKNPYLLRLIVTFLASLLAFMISMIAIYTLSQTLSILSFWAIFITILVSEAWVLVWRVRRDAELRKAEELLVKSRSIKE